MYRHVFLSKLLNDPDMKTTTINDYISPEINVMNMEMETAVCAMSYEHLDYDEDAIIL